MPPKHILNAPTKLMQEIGYGAGYAYDHEAEGAFPARVMSPRKWDSAAGSVLCHVVSHAGVVLFGALDVSGEARLSLETGLLGGFMTFSAFALATGVLWERAQRFAVVYLLVSVLGGPGGVWGMLLGGDYRRRSFGISA